MASNKLQDAVKVFKSRVSNFFGGNDDEKKNRVSFSPPKSTPAPTPVRLNAPAVARPSYTPVKSSYQTPDPVKFLNNFTQAYKGFNQQQEKNNQAKVAANTEFTKNILARNPLLANTGGSDFATQKVSLSQPVAKKPSLWDVSAKKTSGAFQSGMGVALQATQDFSRDALPVLYKATNPGLLQGIEMADKMIRMSLPEKDRKILEAVQQTAQTSVDGFYDKIDPIQGSSKMLKQAGIDTSKVGNEMEAKLDPIEDRGFWGNIRNPQWMGRQIGTNALPMAATTIPGIAVGFLTKNPQLASSIIMGTSFTQSSGDTFNEAKAYGADEETAQGAAVTVGVGNALLDRMGVGLLLNRIPGGKTIQKNIIKEFASTLVKEGLQEASTEMIQQVLQNAVAKHAYDPIREYSAGVPESGLISGILGGTTSAGTSALNMAVNPDFKPQSVAGVQSISKDEGFKQGNAIQDELDRKLETPVGPEWDNSIKVVKDADGNVLLQRNSFNLDTKEQTTSTAPIDYVYRAVSPDQFVDIMRTGQVTNDGVFRYGDPSLMLDPQQGGYVLKIRASDLPKDIAPDGESIAVSQPISANNIEMINGKNTGLNPQALESTATAPVASSKAEPKTFYRGGGEGAVPRGITAQDVINYESNDLGNKDITVEPGINPETINSDNLVWLTETEDAASQYGNPEAVTLSDYVIIARDKEGGVLIEKINSKTSGAQQLPAETTLYRGVSKGKTGLEASADPAATYGAGIYLTDNQNVAKDYNENVVSLSTTKPLNLYTPTEAERLEIVGLYGKEQEAYIKSLLGENYDGLSIPDRNGDGNEIIVYDETLIKQQEKTPVQIIQDQMAAQLQPEKPQDLAQYYASQDQDAVGQAHDEVISELEVAEPGQRMFNENGEYTRSTESTYPSWVPDELRRADIFRSVLAGLSDITNLTYPPNNQPRKQALYDAVLAEIDSRAGTDSSTILATLKEQNAQQTEAGSQSPAFSSPDGSGATEQFTPTTQEITNRGEQSTAQTADIGGDQVGVGPAGISNADLNAVSTESKTVAEPTMTEADYKLAMDALANRRGYQSGDYGQLGDIPTDQELAMQQLRARQGEFAPSLPVSVTEIQIAPKSKRFINQLNKMKSSAEEQIAQAEQTLATYDSTKLKEKIAALPEPEALTATAREQVGELAQIRDGVITELAKVDSIIAQYDTNKKYSKTMMSLKDFKEYRQELATDLDTVNKQISSIVPDAFIPSAVARPIMTKAEIKAHVKELKADIGNINQQIEAAQKDVREVTKQMFPGNQPVPTDQELAMAALQKKRVETSRFVTDPDNVSGDAAPYLAEALVKEEPAIKTAANQAVITQAEQVVSGEPTKATETTSGKKKRGYIERMEKDPGIPDKIRSEIGNIDDASYWSITNKGTLQQAIDSVISNPDDTLNRVLISKDENGVLDSFDEPGSMAESALIVAEGFVLTRKFIAEGNIDMAERVMISTAKRGTKFAQGLQAFAIWSKMTPEGMWKFAQNEVNAYNKSVAHQAEKNMSFGLKKDAKLSDETRAYVLEQMKIAQSMPDGVDKSKIIQDVMKRIAKDIPPGWGDIFNAYRYQNLLSNPLTHLRNILGNITQVGVVKPLDMALAATFDLIPHLGESGDKKTYFSDIPAYYRAAFGSINAASMAAANSFNQGAVQASASIDMQKVRMDLIPSKLTYVPRVLEAQDQFMLVMSQAALRAQMMRHGMSEAEANTQAYDESMKLLYKNESDFKKNKTEQGAVLHAYDGLMEALYLFRRVPVLGWAIPFIKTPINIAKMQLEYSPLGVFTMIGSGHKKQQFRKALIGSTVTTLGWMTAAAGRTTWEPPKDEKERDAWYAMGNKPYGIWVSTPIGEKCIPMNYLGVYALAFMIPTALKHFQEDSKTALSDDGLTKVTKAVGSLVKFYANSTPLGSLNELTSVLNSTSSTDVGAIFGNMLGQVVPLSSLTRYVATVVDPVFREAKGVVGGIQSGIPFWSKSLPAYTTPSGAESRRNLSNYFLPYAAGSLDSAYIPILEAERSKNQANAVKNSIAKKVEKSVDESIRVGLKTGSTNGSLVSTKAGATGGAGLTGMNEAQIKAKTSRINELMDLYEQTSDPKIRGDIETAIQNEGVSFDQALEALVMKDIKTDFKGLSPVAQKKLEDSNRYELMRGLREKYGTMGLGEDYIQSKYQELGITPEQLLYDDKTKLPTDVGIDQIVAETDGMTGTDLLDKLVEMRVKSQGTRKPQLSDTLVGDLVDRGVITKEQGKWLKTIDWDLEKGEFITTPGSGSGDGDKPNKFTVSVPKVKSATVSKTPFGIPEGGMGNEDFARKISGSTRGTNSLPPMPASLRTQLGLKTTKSEKISPLVRTPVKTLSELGR